MTEHLQGFSVRRAAIATVVAGVLAPTAVAQPANAIELLPPINLEQDASAPAQELTADELADEQRNALLQWLDEELYNHVLFRPSDIDELRSKIDALSPTALEAYTLQTDRLRELMRTEDWLHTNKFFSYYRTLETVLSPEQAEEVATGAAKLPPATIVRIMRDLIERYDRLQMANEASTRQSQATVTLRGNVIADQDRMRQYALQQAANRNSRNYFAPYRAVGTVRRDLYRVPGPLITSRGMARLVVYRNLWYGR
jgi:hypothetical protein